MDNFAAYLEKRLLWRTQFLGEASLPCRPKIATLKLAQVLNIVLPKLCLNDFKKTNGHFLNNINLYSCAGQISYQRQKIIILLNLTFTLLSRYAVRFFFNFNKKFIIVIIVN